MGISLISLENMAKRYNFCSKMAFINFFQPPSLSISLLFPPTMSETETYGSCSESNETPRATQFSYSIMSFFPPARSQSKISKNFARISTDPSISASPIHKRNSNLQRKFYFANAT